MCDSFSSLSARNITPDCWETCNWSGNDEEGDNGDSWGSCSDWSLDSEGSYSKLQKTNVIEFSPPVAESTPKKSATTAFQLADQLQQAMPAKPVPFSPVRRSPRVAVQRPKFDPSRAVTTEDG